MVNTQRLMLGNTSSPIGFERVGQILPLGVYQATFQNVRPKLVCPGSTDDYFARDQISLWGIDGFWGLPHHPRTEYYWGRSVLLLGKARLFEFIVPMFPHTWLKPDVVMGYRARSTSDLPPTALAISVLDVKEPSDCDGDPEVVAHWCLAHYLLDGHHKVFAASQERHAVGLLSFIALKQGVSTVQQVEQALDEFRSDEDNRRRDKQGKIE